MYCIIYTVSYTTTTTAILFVVWLVCLLFPIFPHNDVTISCHRCSIHGFVRWFDVMCVRQSACRPTSSSSLHAASSIQHMVNRTVLFGSFSVLRHRTSRKSRPIPTKTKKMEAITVYVEFITIDFIGSRRKSAVCRKNYGWGRFWLHLSQRTPTDKSIRVVD